MRVVQPPAACYATNHHSARPTRWRPNKWRRLNSLPQGGGGVRPAASPWASRLEALILQTDSAPRTNGAPRRARPGLSGAQAIDFAGTEQAEQKQQSASLAGRRAAVSRPVGPPSLEAPSTKLQINCAWHRAVGAPSKQAHPAGRQINTRAAPTARNSLFARNLAPDQAANPANKLLRAFAPPRPCAPTPQRPSKRLETSSAASCALPSGG